MFFKRFGTLFPLATAALVSVAGCGPADDSDDGAEERRATGSQQAALRVDSGNTVYGHWQGSGGRNPASAANRTLLFDSAGPGVAMTFTLTSIADSYLYVLDAGGSVLAQDDNSGGGGHARLTVTLPLGSYRLIAATSAVGQTAEFTLSSGQGLPALPTAARGQARHRFAWIYDDSGTGANDDVAIWRPDLSQYPGFYSLGDVTMGSYGVARR